MNRMRRFLMVFWLSGGPSGEPSRLIATATKTTKDTSEWGFLVQTATYIVHSWLSDSIVAPETKNVGKLYSQISWLEIVTSDGKEQQHDHQPGAGSSTMSTNTDNAMTVALMVILTVGRLCYQASILWPDR
ncbi:hypothetical protein BJX99DRAFT_222005 [Aspergillus californicus]